MSANTTNTVKKTSEGKYVYKTELSRITEKQQQNQTPKEKGAKDLRGISQKKRKKCKRFSLWEIKYMQIKTKGYHFKLSERQFKRNTLKQPECTVG